MPTVSIIIPCYNTQDTLGDTLRSLLDQSLTAWEAIIVNDGSTDNVEAIALEWVEKDSRFKYFKKENGGLGSARNFGIRQAKGAFILPLDADNLISPEFTSKALTILQDNPTVGVVYGDARYFGEREGIWKVGPIDVLRMLAKNQIDACAVLRKEVFDNLGLYDEDIPHQGNEDWEFWLRVIASEYDFFYLEEIAFHYRVSKDSMIRSFDHGMFEENRAYIRRKHAHLYATYYDELYNKNIEADRSISSMKSSRLVRLYNTIRSLVGLKQI